MAGPAAANARDPLRRDGPAAHARRLRHVSDALLELSVRGGELGLNAETAITFGTGLLGLSGMYAVAKVTLSPLSNGFSGDTITINPHGGSRWGKKRVGKLGPSVSRATVDFNGRIGDNVDNAGAS